MSANHFWLAYMQGKANRVERMNIDVWRRLNGQGIEVDRGETGKMAESPVQVKKFLIRKEKKNRGF